MEANPGSVTAADFDGDRKPDLAVTTLSDATVSVSTNHGGGEFREATSHKARSLPTSVAAADLGDKKPDLAVSNLGPIVLSRITSRLNSATAPKTWNTSFPPGVVVSKDSRRDTNSTPCCRRSFTSPMSFLVLLACPGVANFNRIMV